MNTADAARAEKYTSIYALEDLDMLVEIEQEHPDLTAYPISGDMLAIINRGTYRQRTVRRRIAAAYVSNA